MPASNDNKIHHFCFAYNGPRLDTSVLDELNIMQASGTSSMNGLQFVRITLRKQNGKRIKAVPNVISAYNEKTRSIITPVQMHGLSSTIVCFNLTQPISENPILWRIEMDRPSSRYWSWTSHRNDDSSRKPLAILPSSIRTSSGQTVRRSKPKQVPAQAPSKHLLAVISSFLDENGFDTKTVSLEDIGESMKRAYLNTHESILKDNPSLSKEDIQFVRDEMARYIVREKMFLVSPPVNKHETELDTNAKALIVKDSEGALMDDLLLTAEKGPELSLSGVAPNETIVRFFKTMLQQWSGTETVRLTSREIASAINNNDAGVYRHTCIPNFMRPFLQDRSVETSDNRMFTIHVEHLRSKIFQH